jgi:hypothetical protein
MRESPASIHSDSTERGEPIMSYHTFENDKATPEASEPDVTIRSDVNAINANSTIIVRATWSHDYVDRWLVKPERLSTYHVRVLLLPRYLRLGMN